MPARSSRRSGATQRLNQVAIGGLVGQLEADLDRGDQGLDVGRLAQEIRLDFQAGRRAGRFSFFTWPRLCGRVRPGRIVKLFEAGAG